MNPDYVPLDNIEGTDDDQLDPNIANNLQDAIFSAQDPDDVTDDPLDDEA